MSIKRPGIHIRLEPALAVSFPPVGRAELLFLQIEIGDFAPAWSVELHGICAAAASLVVLPDGGDDIAGPSFQITREVGGFRLDQIHWDMMTEVGTFTSLPDVVDAMRPRMAFAARGGAPASATLH